MNIREAIASDIDDIATLHADSWSAAYRGQYADAFLDGDDDARWGTLLDNIHVQPDRKREGIGLKLMRDVGRLAHATYPAAGLYLWVLEANAAARRFYERLGAANAERTTSEPPGGGTVISLRYVWPDVTMLVAATEEGAAR